LLQQEGTDTAQRLSQKRSGSRHDLERQSTDRFCQYATLDYAAISQAYYELGRQTEFAAAFIELRELESDDAAEPIAQIYAWTGELDEAFKWLDIVAEKEDPVRITDYLNPFYRNLHADPRWNIFLEKLGRSPEQLAMIEFEVNLPD